MTKQTFIVILLLIPSVQFIRTFANEIPLHERAQVGKHFWPERAQLELAAKLLQKTGEEGESVVISPLSVSTALFTIYLAADGTTKQEMLEFLGKRASEHELRFYFAELLARIDSVTNENYTLTLANRFYVRRDSSVKESFDRVLQQYFGERLYNFEFSGKKQLVKDVNGWISNKTNNKISKLIKEEDINSATKTLILNAVYFSATWERQFYVYNTRDGVFHISANRTKTMPTMRMQETVPYYTDSSVRVIKLPYISDENLEMVLILPKIRFGLSDVLKNLTAENLLQYISKTIPKLIGIKLPKFRVEVKMNLKESLQEIGITDIFSESANFGELTDEPISVNNVMHAAFIQVDEKGTESAAATDVDTEDRMSPYALFRADEPFLFAIVKNSATILFAGQYAG